MLKEILIRSLGKLVEVDKIRDIFYVGNVKFHLDTVKGLGTFVEMEAIDDQGDIGKDKLLEQCNYYLKLFDINEKDLLEDSYSDMIKRQKE
jgi:predicted adenylyl cyclase CyaB